MSSRPQAPTRQRRPKRSVARREASLQLPSRRTAAVAMHAGSRRAPARRPIARPFPAPAQASSLQRLRVRLTPLATSALSLAKRYKRWLQAGVLALILVFIVRTVASSWSQLAHYSWHVQWGLLVAAFALLVAQELSFALIWRTILARLGSSLDIVSSERIYLGAEFVRYIPGNVWHVITRVLWAEQRGVPKSVGLASMVIELATKIGTAALVFAATLLFWPDAHVLAGSVPRDVLVGAGVVGVPLLLLGLHPRLLGAALNRGLRLLKREPVRIPLGYRDLLVIAGCWTLSWLVAGAGFYLLALAIAPTPPTLVGLVLAIGIYALGWDVGFLSFVTPSGLGFREVAIAALLVFSGLVPAAAGTVVATVIALLARLLTTGAEVSCIAAAHLVSPVSPVSSHPLPDDLPRD